MNDLSDNLSLRAYLGLNKLPHYTALIKFTQKLPSKLLHKMLVAFKHLVEQPEQVALDATGLSLDNASPHYCKRIGLKKRPYLKASFLVDIKQYIILLAKLRKKARHDTKDALPIINKLCQHYQPSIFYADRGYDANYVFKAVFEKLKAYPLILQKRLDVPKHRRKGEYRKLTVDEFDYGEYLQRNKVETTMSILKRRHGFTIKSRHVKCQKAETLCRIIAHNVERLLRQGKEIILTFVRITRVSY
jgi:transposase